MSETGPAGLSPDAGGYRIKLITRYTDGTSQEELWREEPHGYAELLSAQETVDSVRIEAPCGEGPEEPEWHEYRDGAEVAR